MAKKRATRGTGSVFEAPDRKGLYVGQITINGKRHRVYAKSRTGARDKLNELLRKGPDDLPTTLTINTLLTEWLVRDVAGREIAPSTESRHRWAADHLKRELGTVGLGKLTTRDVEAALEDHQATGLGKASLTKILQTLSRAITYAERMVLQPVDG